LIIESGVIKGRVTSVSFSPSAGRIIGLAYVAPHQAEIGSVFEIRTDNGKMAKATVVKTPFFNVE
jgi:sarcosine oxidase subunit alpha